MCFKPKMPQQASAAEQAAKQPARAAEARRTTTGADVKEVAGSVPDVVSGDIGVAVKRSAKISRKGVPGLNL